MMSIDRWKNICRIKRTENIDGDFHCLTIKAISSMHVICNELWGWLFLISFNGICLFDEKHRINYLVVGRSIFSAWREAIPHQRWTIPCAYLLLYTLYLLKIDTLSNIHCTVKSNLVLQGRTVCRGILLIDYMYIWTIFSLFNIPRRLVLNPSLRDGKIWPIHETAHFYVHRSCSAVTIFNLGLCVLPFELEGIFIVLHLLCLGASVFAVLSKGLPNLIPFPFVGLTMAFCWQYCYFTL